MSHALAIALITIEERTICTLIVDALPNATSPEIGFDHINQCLRVTNNRTEAVPLEVEPSTWIMPGTELLLVKRCIDYRNAAVGGIKKCRRVVSHE